MSLPDEAISDEGLDYTALPLGWAISKTSDAINIDGVIADGDWIESKDQDPNGGVRLIQLADIGDGYFRNKSERFMTTENAIRMNCTFLKSGDVLIARMPDPLGRACIFPGIDQEAVTVVDICLIRVNIESAIKNKLLMYWINTPQVRNYIAMQSTGTTRKRITRKKLEVLELPIPPLAEQQQIAAKLDELLAQVDNLKTRLNNIPKILKRFRQSVLAAAVSGKLTEEWRSSEDLIDWKQSLLGDLVNKPSYGTSSKSQEEGKIPVLRMGNLQDGKLNWSNLVYTSDEDEIRKYRLYSGDILFNRTNSPELVGKTSIYRGEREAIYAGYLIRVQCTNELNPEYLNILLNSTSARAYCRAVKSDGVSQSNINAQKLIAYPVNCPPIEEQTEIVARVEQLFTYADQIEQRVKDAQSRVNHLTQAILAKAFRGELTADWRAQNPELISGENSAEALLARIKTEREQTQAVKKAKATPSN